MGGSGARRKLEHLDLARRRGARALDAREAELVRDLVVRKAVLEAQGPAQQISTTGDKTRFRQTHKSAGESGEESVSEPCIEGRRGRYDAQVLPMSIR